MSQLFFLSAVLCVAHPELIWAQNCSETCRACGGPEKDQCLQCHTGFSLHDNVCVDIDECGTEVGQCPLNTYCLNTRGSYQCRACDEACTGCMGGGPARCRKCAAGYRSSGMKCLDIDECSEEVLACPGLNVICVNTHGSFHCHCAEGYTRKSTSCERDQAADDSTELQTQIINLFKSLAVQLQDLMEKCKGDLFEVKDGHSNTRASLLENFVYLVETVCIVLWVCGYCGSVLRPLKSSLQKKKKKRKETSTVTPAVLTGFQEFSGGLQSLLAQTLEHIKSQESDLTALKLGSLTLEGQTQTEAEGSFMKTAMDKVQSSYLRSLQEIGELLKKRADSLKSLKI